MTFCKIFIGGEWVPPVKGQYFENPTPVTGRTFTEVARGTAEDIELALDAAHGAAPAWGRTPAADRSAVLLKIADTMGRNLEILAVAETWDNGKPDLERNPAQVRPVSSQGPAHLFGPRGDVGQTQVVAAARPGHLAPDDLPERLRISAPVVRDAQHDYPAAVAQPDDRTTCPSVNGRIEDALAGHLEQRPADRRRQRHLRAGHLHAHVELICRMPGLKAPQHVRKLFIRGARALSQVLQRRSQPPHGR